MGNWKMNKTVAEAREFAEQLGQQSQSLCNDADYAVCAPFTSLHILRVMLPANVKLGAQNVHFEEHGAYTGEISASMLKEFETVYVLAGHSERRQLFGETDEIIAKKVKAILSQQMTPVLCVGEVLDQRDAGKTLDVVRNQLNKGLAELTEAEIGRCVVAYEPVWAIGTGRTATSEQAEEVIAELRAALRQKVGATADDIRILYGGSVKPANVAELCSQPNIDGGLVGGASLQADSFAQMAAEICKGV
ncbi:triose-phosphate isomerase [Alicyclobacillus sp. SO9]|nr:triose-phosphate isomerase [Alicyclobacillus sp. SO9]